MGIGPEHVTANAKQLAVKENMVDASYLSTLGISLKEGRNFMQTVMQILFIQYLSTKLL